MDNFRRGIIAAVLLFGIPLIAQNYLTVFTGVGGTISSAPSGITCSLPIEGAPLPQNASQTCYAAFTSGATVTLTATAATGYVFLGWAGDCNAGGLVTSTTCAITVGSATAPSVSSKTVTATFMAIPPTLSCAGTKYYVDPSGGNDANNGTSTATPILHFPWDPASTWAKPAFNSNDCIVVKGGTSMTPTSSVCFNQASVGSMRMGAIDPSWFTGGAWKPAAFDFGNAVLTVASGSCVSSGGANSGYDGFVAKTSFGNLQYLEFKNFMAPVARGTTTQMNCPGVAGPGSTDTHCYDIGGVSNRAVSVINLHPNTSTVGTLDHFWLHGIIAQRSTVGSSSNYWRYNDGNGENSFCDTKNLTPIYANAGITISDGTIDNVDGNMDVSTYLGSRGTLAEAIKLSAGSANLGASVRRLRVAGWTGLAVDNDRFNSFQNVSMSLIDSGGQVGDIATVSRVPLTNQCPAGPAEHANNFYSKGDVSVANVAVDGFDHADSGLFFFHQDTNATNTYLAYNVYVRLLPWDTNVVGPGSNGIINPVGSTNSTCGTVVGGSTQVCKIYAENFTIIGYDIGQIPSGDIYDTVTLKNFFFGNGASSAVEPFPTSGATITHLNYTALVNKQGTVTGNNLWMTPAQMISGNYDASGKPLNTNAAAYNNGADLSSDQGCGAGCSDINGVTWVSGARSWGIGAQAFTGTANPSTVTLHCAGSGNSTASGLTSGDTNIDITCANSVATCVHGATSGTDGCSATYANNATISTISATAAAGSTLTSLVSSVGGCTGATCSVNTGTGNVDITATFGLNVSSTLSASPTVINYGQSVTLTYSCTNGTQATLTDNLGTAIDISAAPLSGSKVVTPTLLSSPYTYFCFVPGGVGNSANTSVNVIGDLLLGGNTFFGGAVSY